MSDTVSEFNSSSTGIPSPFDALTTREKQVAEALALGHKNAEIAEALQVSVKTVDTHRGHVLKKLSCRNNVELARLAISLGIAPL